MTYCINCGKEVQQESGFCPYCGSALQRVQAVQYQQPVYPYPVVEAQPKVSAGAKVKGFIGMGLGINAFVFGILAAFIGLFFVNIMVLNPGEMDDFMELLSYPLSCGIVAIACAIPGRILSMKAISAGFTKKYPVRGKVFSLIGLILGAVGVVLGIASIIFALS